jgi:sugar lactone lactonase YvrE
MKQKAGVPLASSRIKASGGKLMCRRSRLFIEVLFALSLAMSATASTHDLTSASMTLSIGALPPVTVPGSSASIAVSSGAGTFVEPARVFGPTTVALPRSLFTAIPLLSGLTLTGFENQSVACTQAGPPLGCAGGLAGVALIDVLQFFNLTIPLTPIGSPGASAKTSSGGIEITVLGQGWTAGTASVTGVSTTFSPSGTAVATGTDQRTPAHGGTLVLVSGARVITNFMGNLPGFVTQRLEFSPPQKIDVDVDIKPGGDPDASNPSSRGVTSVAILGSGTFDVLDVDATTLAFGPGAASLAHRNGPHPKDANHDGIPDLLAHFSTEEAGLLPDEEVCVTGELLDGTPFEGCDVVRTVSLELEAGDLLVVDNGWGRLIHVNPVTGLPRIIATGFRNPLGVALDANRDVFVSDAQWLVGGFNTGAILRVDPATGAKTVVASGGSFIDPASIAFDAAGDLIVRDLRRLIRVDLATGEQTIISENGLFGSPGDFALDANGDILIADGDVQVGGRGHGQIIRVDAVTGAQTTVFSGGTSSSPRSVAIEANGDLLVSDNGSFGQSLRDGTILRVDPDTGAQATVSSGGLLFDPFGLAIDGNGDLVVADVNGPQAPRFKGAVTRVDPGTGSQTTISSSALLLSPVDIAIVPDFITIHIELGPTNPMSDGVTAVAILGSDTFDVLDVDTTTLAFGPGAASLAHRNGPHPKDANHDGIPDLLAHFPSEEAGVLPDEEACVTGELLDGTPFEGCDVMRTVPPQ